MNSPSLHRICHFGLLTLAAGLASANCIAAPVLGYRVVKSFPHSVESYTEGFFYLGGLFYEGTGLQGHSSLLAIEPQSGKPVQRVDLPSEYFGEGIVNWGPNIYEWTWQSHICFVYDRFSFRLVRQISYSGEGWGMTHTEKEIVTSDGSSTLRFRDPNSFKETRHIIVKDGTRNVDQLNELEYIKGKIYANVWHSDRIAEISPRDGHVIAWIDLADLLPESQRVNRESVLNGIAYDAVHNRIFVTGKQWPAIFEIKVISKPSSPRQTGKHTRR